jgi:membrane fusion protein (multidrug efflux system)
MEQNNSNSNNNDNNKKLRDNDLNVKKKSRLKVYIPLVLVILIVLVLALYWYIDYSKYVSTDDAHVDSDQVSVSSKIMGRIVHLYGDEGDSVKAGELLAELDSSDLVAQKNQIYAMKEQTISSKTQADAKYNFDRQNIKALEVNVQKSLDDYNRAKDQFSKDVISKEQFEHIQKAYESAKAQLEAANTQLSVSRAQIGSTIASIQNADAQIKVVETQLNNTRIYSPMNGIIAKRWLLPGDIVQPGQSIFTVTNDSNFWIAVYLEETKMEHIQLNQKATFTIDAFPGKTFYGKVFFIGSNTASEFSLIPPNNASGNFTKVTQRVPLKISIEGTEEGDKPGSFKLASGMSAVIKIKKQ